MGEKQDCWDGKTLPFGEDCYDYCRRVFFNRWKPRIITAIYFDKDCTRFSRFTRQLPITEKVLTQNLRELEEDGIINRTIYPEVPLRVEYHLTEQGKRLYPGEFTITEVEPAPGFQMKEPTTQTIILHGGESKTVTFQNEPLNAIVVEKYDSVTHEALPGCTFQLKYLGGVSGTGGTTIGQKVTGKNGTAIWTGLKSGAYIVEEVDPADGYSIIR